eukprot:TRINITY_DN43198_c0_g1_i2.p1 TRINITY_DN43198_c0_g1~~TRINITY_DN43198_c0_g1_i2.p1  ORF type:complete len:252 (+),score=14.06 TRINITY_DN43198_c0_g1_i2:71-757(+)
MSGPFATLCWAPSGEIRFAGPREVAEGVNAELRARFGCGPVLRASGPDSPQRRRDSPSWEHQSADGGSSMGLSDTISPSVSSADLASACASPRREARLAFDGADFLGAVRSAGASGEGPTLRAVVKAIEHCDCELAHCGYTGVGGGTTSGPVCYAFAGPAASAPPSSTSSPSSTRPKPPSRTSRRPAGRWSGWGASGAAGCCRPASAAAPLPRARRTRTTTTTAVRTE